MLMCSKAKAVRIVGIFLILLVLYPIEPSRSVPPPSADASTATTETTPPKRHVWRRRTFCVAALTLGAIPSYLGLEALVLTERDWMASERFATTAPAERLDIAMVGDSLASADGGSRGGLWGGLGTLYRERNDRTGS